MIQRIHQGTIQLGRQIQNVILRNSQAIVRTVKSWFQKRTEVMNAVRNWFWSWKLWKGKKKQPTVPPTSSLTQQNEAPEPDPIPTPTPIQADNVSPRLAKVSFLPETLSGEAFDDFFASGTAEQWNTASEQFFRDTDFSQPTTLMNLENILRSEVRKQLQDELSKRNISLWTILEVVKMTKGVFEFEPVRLIGKALMNRLLQNLMPSEHPSPEQINDSYVYLTNLETAKDQPIRIVTFFDKLPTLDNPSLQVIVDFLSHNKFAYVQIVVPGAKREDLKKLERQAVLKVLKGRATLGIVSRGVNLNLINNQADVPRFLTNQSRTLVYANKAFLEPLENRPETLRVTDNVPLSKRSFALLAAIDMLMERKVIPPQIQDALRILIENIKIAKLAEKVTQIAA